MKIFEKALSTLWSLHCKKQIRRIQSLIEVWYLTFSLSINRLVYLLRETSVFNDWILLFRFSEYNDRESKQVKSFEKAFPRLWSVHCKKQKSRIQSLIEVWYLTFSFSINMLACLPATGNICVCLTCLTYLLFCWLLHGDVDLSYSPYRWLIVR